MAKDEAIRNQKVFVRLDGVLAVQREYKRLSINRAKAKTEDMKNGYTNKADAQRVMEATRYLQGFEKVIELLQLPMEV